MSLGVAIISAIVGLVTLVFAIFGASWLNQRATERFIEQSQLANAGLIEQSQRATEALIEQSQLANAALIEQSQRATEALIEQLERRFDARFDALVSEFRSEIKRLDQRLDSVGDRLDSVEKRLDQRLDSLEDRLDRIERQLEAIFKPALPPRQGSG